MQSNKAKKNSGSKSNTNRSMTRQEAGRKGAEARWGKSCCSPSSRGGPQEGSWGRDYNEGQTNSRRSTSQQSSYAPYRSGSSNQGNFNRRGNEQYGHMSHQEAGRLGAEARWGGHHPEDRDRRGQFSNSNQGYARSGENQRQGGNSQSRNSYGRQQTQSRSNNGWGQSPQNGGYYGQEQGYDSYGPRGRERGWGMGSENQDFTSNRRRQPSFGGMSPQEAGRRGAEERWGHQYDHDEDENYSGYSNQRSDWNNAYEDENDFPQRQRQGRDMRDMYEESEDDDNSYENEYSDEHEDEDEEYESSNRRQRQRPLRNY